MVEDEFEWDVAKAERNLLKHGVGFEAAQYVFDDGFAPGEIRYVITGTVRDVVLTVVYTERGGRNRIISARRATTHEQREYYRSQTAQ